MCEYSGPAPQDQEAHDKEKALKTELKKLEGREKRNSRICGDKAVFVRTKAEKGGARGHTRECACVFFSCDAYLELHRTLRYCSVPG